MIADTRLVPQMAALDPSLMTGLPPAVTAATGMDALTHAVEAFVGQWSTDYTDRMALAAVGMIYENLRVAYRNGQGPRGARADGARRDLRRPRIHPRQRRLRARHRAPARRQVPHAARPRQRDHAAARAALPRARRSPSGWRCWRCAPRWASEGERAAVLAQKFLDSVEALNRDLGIPAPAGRAARGGHSRAGQGRLLGGRHQLSGAALHVAGDLRGPAAPGAAPTGPAAAKSPGEAPEPGGAARR